MFQIDDMINRRERVDYVEYDNYICSVPQFTCYVAAASENFCKDFQLND